MFTLGLGAFVLLFGAAEGQTVDTRDIVLAGTESRVALVIGNADYKHTARLANPHNDAKLVATTLQGLGFSLVTGAPVLDADKQTMERAIRELGRQLNNGAVGLFYFSGHGIQIDGQNFLVPATAQIVNQLDIQFELVNASLVTNSMSAGTGRLSIVILDACRNNPFGKSDVRSISSGLAGVNATAGTVIAYAAEPGKLALDGPPGQNSPYARALVDAMKRPGLGLFDTFNEAAVRVKATTNGRQQPWLAASPVARGFQFTARGSEGIEQRPLSSSNSTSGRQQPAPSPASIPIGETVPGPAPSQGIPGRASPTAPEPDRRFATAGESIVLRPRSVVSKNGPNYPDIEVLFDIENRGPRDAYVAITHLMLSRCHLSFDSYTVLSGIRGIDISWGREDKLNSDPSSFRGNTTRISAGSKATGFFSRSCNGSIDSDSGHLEINFVVDTSGSFRRESQFFPNFPVQRK